MVALVKRVFNKSALAGSFIGFLIHRWIQSYFSKVHDTTSYNLSQEINRISSRYESEDFIGLLNLSIYRTSHVRYFPNEKMLITIAPKAGSTALHQWIYTGITGLQVFTGSSYVQNFREESWEGRIRELNRMPINDRLFALTSPEVVRIAVWRDPFSRLISCWKNKYACDIEKYGTGKLSLKTLLPGLLRLTNGSSDIKCMNISKFAESLDDIRDRLQKGQLHVTQLDVHYRPQEFFNDFIKYDLVLEVNDLLNASSISIIRERFKFKHLVGSVPDIINVSPGKLDIPEEAAIKISRFARLTEDIPLPVEKWNV